MSVRHWNDDSSELRVPVITETEFSSGVFTVAALVKIETKTGFQTLVHGRDSGGATRWVFGVDATTGKPSLFTSFSGGSQYVQAVAGLVVPIATYCVVAVSRSDENTRRFHVIPLGGTALHGASDLVGGMDPPATTAGGYISFGNQADASGSGLLGTMPVVALWTEGLSDGEAEALATSLSSDAWANNAKLPGGAWNFNQADRLDPVPDMTGHHDTITGSLANLADPLGIAGTTIVSDDPSGWSFTFTPPPLHVSLHLSGGASNTDPLLSIGGVLSSTSPAPSLFDNVPAARRTAGSTDYRLIYVRNDETADVTASAVVYEQLETGRQLAVGAATEAAGTTVTAIADRNTAPAGVTFQPTSSVSLGTIPPGEAKGLWLRRVINAGQPEDATNPCEVRITADLA